MMMMRQPAVPEAYAIDIMLSPRQVRISLAGEIDITAQDNLITAARLARPGVPATIDLRAATFCDSWGFAAIEDAASILQARGPVAVLNAPACVAKIGRLLGRPVPGRAMLTIAADSPAADTMPCP